MNCYSVNSERLLKLAELLLSNEYKWYEYRIGSVNSEIHETISSWKTMPVLEVVVSESINVFPEQWIWNEEKENAYYKNDLLMHPFTSALIFYDIDIIMFKHLFMPFNQMPHYFGGEILGHVVRPAQVGSNILAFLKNYKSIMN